MAGVQPGVSERAVPKNAVLCACPLARMVATSANLSLRTLAKRLGSCPGWLSPWLPTGSGSAAASRSHQEAPRLSRGIWWRLLRRRGAPGTSQGYAHWVGGEDWALAEPGY